MRATEAAGAPVERGGPDHRLGARPWEDVAAIRPPKVWRGLSPAAQARVRHTFLRVLVEALGTAPAGREGSRDAPGR